MHWDCFFMKTLSLLVVFCLTSSIGLAKKSKDFRLEVGLNLGGFYSYPKYLNDAKFNQNNTVNNTRINALSNNQNINFIYQLDNSQNIGFGICLFDFTWSWLAQSQIISTTGLTSGHEFGTYEFLGLELTYQRKIAPFNLYLEGGIKILNSAFIVPEDTLYTNSINYVEPIQKYQYIAFPMKIDKGIYLLPYLALYQKFKIANRLYLNIKLGYQQGIKPFLEHKTLIRNTQTGEEGIFTARITGTSIFGQFGIGYKF